jgi:hypothetical protein
MNKQTAVEWLIKQWPILESQLPDWLIEQTKEMEEQNQLDLIRFLRKQDKMGKSVENLLEQFKSEQNESI